MEITHKITFTAGNEAEGPVNIRPKVQSYEATLRLEQLTELSTIHNELRRLQKRPALRPREATLTSATNRPLPLDKEGRLKADYREITVDLSRGFDQRTYHLSDSTKQGRHERIFNLQKTYRGRLPEKL